MAVRVPQKHWGASLPNAWNLSLGGKEGRATVAISACQCYQQCSTRCAAFKQGKTIVSRTVDESFRSPSLGSKGRPEIWQGGLVLAWAPSSRRSLNWRGSMQCRQQLGPYGTYKKRLVEMGLLSLVRRRAGLVTALPSESISDSRMTSQEGYRRNQYPTEH